MCVKIMNNISKNFLCRRIRISKIIRIKGGKDKMFKKMFTDFSKILKNNIKKTLFKTKYNTSPHYNVI